MERHEKFISGCDKVMAFSFYALIYFLPISIALSETFTVLALVCYFLKRGTVFYGRLKESSSSGNKLSLMNKVTCFLKSFKPVSSPLSWPIVFLLFFSFVSILFSQYRLLSLNGFLGKVLQSAFLYFNFIECMNSRRRLKIFFNVFFVSCALICINGIFQAIVGHGFIHGHVFSGRISSSLRHANDLAAYLIVIIPVLFCMVFLTNTKKRDDIEGASKFTHIAHHGTKIAHLFLFLLGFVCLGLTYSRGAWVGFILSLLLMCLFGLRNRKMIVSNILLVVFFLAIFYPGTPYMKILGQRFHLPTKTSVSAKVSVPTKVSVSTDASVPMEASFSSTGTPELNLAERSKQAIDDRFHMVSIYEFLVSNNRLGYWRRSFKIIRDYPIFGCGLNTYALIEGRYNVGWGGYPHNSYLQMAAETGLMGVAIFLWMLFVLFHNSLKALKRIDIQKHKMLLFGFLTGLMGFLIHSFFDTNLYSVQLSSLLWVIMGTIVALQKIEKA